MTLRDRTLATLVGLVAFAVYLATIYPGLLGIGDATKFAFVGKVLGIPHAPGYPLYVMVSHVFSYLPLGTLAYRMNVLSALFGALAVGLSYFIARRLGVSRAVAASAALALGFGNAFWAISLYAKTYTLNAALVAAGVLALLRWDERRKNSDLYWAVAIFALSLGNHLTVVALLPALLLFPLLTAPRTALRPSTIAAVLLIVLLGLMQYGLIIVRTMQGAPYLEARASNMRELWAVMTARRFAYEIGAYSPSALLSTRIPVVATLVRTELGLAGGLLVVVGLVVLVARQPRRALFFALGALGVMTLTADMSSGEDQGFLLSAFVLLWPVAGLGLESICTAIPRLPWRVTAVVMLIAAVLLPANQVVSNYRANDHHTETFETAYFDALFAALPQNTAIVSDEYRLNMAVLYKLLGERAGGTRNIHLIPAGREQVSQARANGFDVLAFQEGRRILTEYGFSFTPFNIPASGAAEAAVRARAIYRVASSPCLAIGNQGWLDISDVLRPDGWMTARLDNYRPFDATLTVYAGTDVLVRPALVGIRGTGTPKLDVDTFARDDPQAHARLMAMMSADQATVPAVVLASPYVMRASIRVNDRGDYSFFGLDLGGHLTAAVGSAVVDSDSAQRASVCPHSLEGIQPLPNGDGHLIILPESSNVQFEQGWYAPETRPSGQAFRWTTDRAALVVPLTPTAGASHTVTLEAASLIYYPRSREATVTLVVNGYRIGTRPLSTRITKLSWDVPGEHLRYGLNELRFEVDGAKRPSDVSTSPDGRLLGLSMTRLELNRIDR